MSNLERTNIQGNYALHNNRWGGWVWGTLCMYVWPDEEEKQKRRPEERSAIKIHTFSWSSMQRMHVLWREAQRKPKTLMRMAKQFSSGIDLIQDHSAANNNTAIRTSLCHNQTSRITFRNKFLKGLATLYSQIQISFLTLLSLLLEGSTDGHRCRDCMVSISLISPLCHKSSSTEKLLFPGLKSTSAPIINHCLTIVLYCIWSKSTISRYTVLNY